MHKHAEACRSLQKLAEEIYYCCPTTQATTHPATDHGLLLHASASFCMVMHAYAWLCNIINGWNWPRLPPTLQPWRLPPPLLNITIS